MKLQNASIDIQNISLKQIFKTQGSLALPIYTLNEPGLIFESIDQMCKNSLSRTLKQMDLQEGKDKSALFYSPELKKEILVLILGAKNKVQAHAVRLAYSNHIKTLKSKWPILLVLPKDNQEEALEGSLQGLYEFKKYFSDNENKTKKVFLCQENINHLKPTIELVDAIFFARNIVNEPANEIHPSSMENLAKKVARTQGLKCKVFHQKDLIRNKMNLINAVGKASDIEPRLVELTYKPKNFKKTIVLVGKGVTFDSGGLSLKPQNNMYGMKNDMAGSAAVLGLMSIVSKFKLKVCIHAFLPLVENLVSGSSTKPGDVVIGFNGKSVEIENTDAEGRLIMADALAYASTLKPDLMIDMATLTGACVVALGDEISAAFSNEDDQVDKFINEAKQTGEKFWKMPLEENYKKMLKSDVADMKNVGARYAGAITAALFLKEFVGQTPWIHLDIAGPAFADSPNEMGIKGATGFPIKTLLSFLQNI